jgi:hypothetical protein
MSMAVLLLRGHCEERSDEAISIRLGLPWR